MPGKQIPLLKNVAYYAVLICCWHSVIGTDMLLTLNELLACKIHCYLSTYTSGAARVKKVGGKMTLQVDDVTHRKSQSRPVTALCVHPA